MTMTNWTDVAAEADLFEGAGIAVAVGDRERRRDPLQRRAAVLEHGQVVEQGTHEELIARRGLYTSLYGDWAADVA